MGRTGTLWAFEKYGIYPDILLLGKAFGGGMPLGAFISSKHHMDKLSFDPVLGHITTFGGHPVSCAAGHAALKTIIDDNIIQEIPQKEKLFRELLISPKIKAFHSEGLLGALELDDFNAVQKVISYCLDKGLIMDWFLFNSTCVRIAPPLLITFEEIKYACSIILEALG